YRPLQCKVVIVIKRDTFIRGPAHRAVVYDDILMQEPAETVSFHPVLTAHSKAQITDDDIIGGDHQRIAFNRDTITGSRLTGNRNVVISDGELRLQINRSGS